MEFFVALALPLLCNFVPPGLCQDQPKPPGVLQHLQSTASDLSDSAHDYLVTLVGANSVEAFYKCVHGAVRTLAGGVASGLNVVAVYLTHFLDAAGINVTLPFEKVTPEGLLFVTQWALLFLIGYWLLSLALRLVASTLRRALWLIKVSAALGAFGWILSDVRASGETTALRLAGLLCACVLLGLGSSSSSVAGVDEKTASLEQQVRTLERRVREVERRRKEE